jgi:hypothetical protein
MAHQLVTHHARRPALASGHSPICHQAAPPRFLAQSWCGSGGLKGSGVSSSSGRTREQANRNIDTWQAASTSNRAVYPVWTDGRNNAIERAGIGETDIFTSVELR